MRGFGERLRALMGDDPYLRPFVCDGDPTTCPAFVVGINPASSTAFWPYWCEETGFRKAAWLDAYREARAAASGEGARKRPPLSNTRRRLEWIAAAAPSTRILETNLYGRPTPKASDLDPADRDMQVFDFLVAALRPRLLVLHGAEVREHFRKQYGYALTRDFAEVAVNGRRVAAVAVGHLSRMSRRDAERLGRDIAFRCAA